MKITATKLRQNLYHMLDEVIKTGRPIEIERKGKVLRIVPEEQKSKLSNLEFHDVIIGNPKEIIHMDWTKEWNIEDKM